MEKILTIVIPTYNMQDHLRRCLDSLDLIALIILGVNKNGL